MTEREIEAAEAAVSAESDTAIARIREQLASPGGADCISCDRPIPPARRAALPSAQRCIRCQTDFDRRHRVFHSHP